MTITMTEFQKAVRTPTARQLGKMGDRHYTHEGLYTDGMAAFWGKPMPEGGEIKTFDNPKSILDYLQGCAERATLPLSIRGVRVDSWKSKPGVTEAILETEDGRFILVNAKYLAYALKGMEGATIRADSDEHAPIAVFGANGGLVAIIMPRLTAYASPGWQTVAGQGLPGWEPPPPPSAEEISEALDEATDEERE